MVSGAIGGFLDVALNFNTQAMVDDNLLGKLILAKVVNHISCFWDGTELQFYLSTGLPHRPVFQDWLENGDAR